MPTAPLPSTSHAPEADDTFNLAYTPPEFVKQGADWVAIFNSHIPRRRLDVSLRHSFIHDSVVCCVRFSPDGKYLATGCRSSAQIYDTTSGEKICVFIDQVADQDVYIHSLCFSPDGKYLATGAEDKQIRIWEISKRRMCDIDFKGHRQEIYALKFSPNGRLLVSGSGDGTVRIWDLETGRHMALVIPAPPGVDTGITTLAFSPDGRLVASGSLDSVVRIWDVESGLLIERLAGHANSVYSIAFTPDGEGLISGSLDRTIKHWDLGPLLRNPLRDAPLHQRGPERQSEKGCVCTTSYIGHTDYVLAVAVSQNAEWVLSGSKDRCVRLWDRRTSQAQVMLQGHRNSVVSVDMSPVGGMFATGSGDWDAKIWSYTELG